MITKFHGKFKDLIPAGFKFQKLFARNYRQYCWRNPENPYSDETIDVWQHNGGYVEIAGLGLFSSLIFKAFAVGGDHLEQFYCTGKMSSFYKFVINRNTNELEVYDIDKHNTMRLYFLNQDGKITDEEMDEMHKEMIRIYKEVVICKDSWLANAIRTMIEKEWVKF